MQIKRRDKAVDHSHPAQDSWLTPWGIHLLRMPRSLPSSRRMR